MTEASSESVSLTDLIALNDEMLAMLRAGVPLDVGLRQFSGSATGRLSTLSSRLADHLERGESPNDALASETDGFPPIYRCVIQAGLASGKLPEALDSLARYARIAQRVRRQVILSMIYPAFIVLLAYVLFWLLATTILPGIATASLNPGDAPTGWMQLVNRLSGVMSALHLFPIAILIVLFVVWVLSTRKASRGYGIGTRGLRWIPGLKSTFKKLDLANFSELASMMVAHRVPVGEALTLAADATGDARMAKETRELVNMHNRGEPLDRAVQSAKSYPAMMRWMIRIGARQNALDASLAQIATHYRRKADASLDRFTLLFPFLLTAVVAGGAVLVFGLAVLVPFVEMMKSLGSLG